MTKDKKKFLKWLILFLGTIFWLPIFYKLYYYIEDIFSKGISLNIHHRFLGLYLFATVIFLFLLIFILRNSFLYRWFFLPIIVGGFVWLLSGLISFNLLILGPNSCIPVLVKDYESFSETNSVLVAELCRATSILSYQSASSVLGIAFGVVIFAFIFSIIGIFKIKNNSPVNSNDTTTNFQKNNF